MTETKTGENLFFEYMLFLQKEGFSIIRANLASRSIHPQVEAFSYTFFNNKIGLKTVLTLTNSQQDLIYTNSEYSLIANRFSSGALRNSAYRASPIYLVFETKKPYSYKIPKDALEFPYSLMQDLHEVGGTEYHAVPIFPYNSAPVFLSYSTNREGGFTEEMKEQLNLFSRIFSTRWGSYAMYDMMSVLLQTYLGKLTGSQVLSGKINRGDIEEIDSVIWFSDMRNYTSLSQNHSNEEVLQILNQYFEIVIPLIEECGGEVLKLIGDAILAVFPIRKGYEKQTHFRSLVCARRSIDELKEYSSKKEFPISHGIGLHSGKVKYGNIGSEDRLDFTVIGDAVNLTSRIASLCSKFEKSVLASEEFSDQVEVPWVDLGPQNLKGFSAEKSIYGL